jgi:hypothetical protein
MEPKAQAEEVSRPVAEDRVLGRLDYALRNLRTTITQAERALPPEAPLVHAPSRRIADPQRQSLPTDRKRAALALALGHAHFGAGALGAAEREFRDAVSSEPGNADAHCSLVVTLTTLGRLDDAEQELRAAEQAGVRLSPSVREAIEKRRAAGNS